MKSVIGKTLATIVTIGVAAILLMDQVKSDPGDEAATLDQYDIIFYGSSTRSSPNIIMRLDNNAEILLACVSGRTQEGLKEAGFRFTESQLTLLEEWGLLESDEDVLKTAFPVIDLEKAKILRAETKEHGYQLGHKIHKDLKALKEKLQPKKRLLNHYTILFSYVIDGLVWDLFEEKGLLGLKDITVENPFWTGMLWVIYPPRQFSCGTNTISHEDISLKINWSEATLPKMKALHSRKNIEAFLNDYVDRGKIRNQDVIDAYVPLNILDRSGRITVPVIVEKRGDPLYEICLSISRNVVDYVMQEIDLTGMKHRLGLRDEGQALLIVYHELMWDMMDYLEAQGLTRKPNAFASPDRAQPKDIGDLVFIVDHARRR
ncbi:MAG: hypothetical protein GTO51_08610 [Candidatus Latescibacteria bacterium]|nr:hypothetical protein [Candidatus Latescibacterota bacterium]NIM22015.1 hypothetical protein [Candidatus Latescibacterota bacterium]NIM66033.1 hypothetical protein [Candidatus Latescibacterota bacterium]NIO02441.1 hypothetical protein [Candidatus Latescibacterota bacterium]NIO29352.1 hypothetical protein [Candidatus Latescibacterota bacterium]